MNYDSPDRVRKDSMSGIGLDSDRNNESPNKPSEEASGDDRMNIEN